MIGDASRSADQALVELVGPRLTTILRDAGHRTGDYSLPTAFPIAQWSRPPSAAMGLRLLARRTRTFTGSGHQARATARAHQLLFESCAMAGICMSLIDV
jgi:hypothetical protein